ncbi:hypothetical protein AtubIFM54640_005794 [Aspergillus tubingensis]|nr:hypothetical protein AtubIFM54640_005794 [Aspergillus tubingensis]GLB17797.1 hypothetical protein AtubIFM61612_007686 [Aspergillus tubingensis]
MKRVVSDAGPASIPFVVVPISEETFYVAIFNDAGPREITNLPLKESQGESESPVTPALQREYSVTERFLARPAYKRV